MTLNTAKESESCIEHKLSFCFTFLCDPDLGQRTLILIMTYHLIIVYLFMKSNYTCFSKSKSRKENPQKLTQLSSRSHPRHLVGKRTAQKDITIDTTSDSQVNSNFPNKWSQASLTFNNYFYLFLYLYIT